MELSDWIGLASALIALVGVLLAVGTYWRSVHERRRAALAEIEAVAVSWHSYETPVHPESDGTALWRYAITVQNPGRLPVRAVQVQLAFPRPVRRLHYDGSMDDPTLTFELHQAVVLAGDRRTWKRAFVLPFAERDSLKAVGGRVTFVTNDGKSHTNIMDVQTPE